MDFIYAMVVNISSYKWFLLFDVIFTTLEFDDILDLVTFDTHIEIN